MATQMKEKIKETGIANGLPKIKRSRKGQGERMERGQLKIERGKSP